MTITRSHGIGVQGFIIGGGAPTRLDLEATVNRAAELLAGLYKQDVEIRYNSDGRSGSAWLKDDLPGLDNSCQVGLGAALYADWRGAGLTSLEPDFLERTRELPDVLHVTTFLVAERLTDLHLADQGPVGRRYAYPVMPDLETALEWLIEHDWGAR